MPTCTRCQRAITDPISIGRGFGPLCWADVVREREQDGHHLGGELGLFDAEVRLERDLTAGGQPLTNVTHRVARATTGALEWGSTAGPGADDLALNILLAFTDKTTAIGLSRDFRAQFLDRIPAQGGAIPRKQIQAWVNGRTGVLPFDEEGPEVAPEPAAPTYVIRNLRDMSAIPADRIDAFLADLRTALMLAKGAEALGDAFAKSIDPDVSATNELDELEWVDDGAGNVIEMNIEGEHIASIPESAVSRSIDGMFAAAEHLRQAR